MKEKRNEKGRRKDVRTGRKEERRREETGNLTEKRRG